MRALFVSVFFLSLLCPSTTKAQDFYGTGLSADTSRRAGIFQASSSNAGDALELNPAGLAALRGAVVDLSLNGTFARGSFSNASNNASPMASNYGYVPFGAIGTSLGEHWAVGFGVAPDLLSASKWNYSDTPGYAGTTYGPQSEKSQILGVRGAVGIAYRFSDRLSAGFSVGADYNSNTLNAPYIFQSQPIIAGLKTLLDLHTTGYGWNSSYGLTAHPVKRLDLAASFRTSTSITSHGHATGNIGAEFATLGLAAPSAFAYRSQVHITLPPSALLSVGWQATQAFRLSFQTDWIGWRGAFNSLPVTLTDGSNSAINGVLNSTTLKDTVPLEWKDQITFRGAIERSFGERFTVSAGYLHGNNPVPNATVSPLTAAIMQNGIATGLGWHNGRFNFGVSYGYDFTAQQSIGNSALLYDEYSNARTKIGTQAFTLSTSFHL